MMLLMWFLLIGVLAYLIGFIILGPNLLLWWRYSKRRVLRWWRSHVMSDDPY